MKKAFIISAFICSILFILFIPSCSKSDLTSRPGLTPITFTIPQGWPQPVYNFTSNPLTVEGFELGKKLFYDGRLSKDGNFPCASCHQQFAAFANFDHDLSHGVNNQFTTRNAPGLFNMVWLDKLHWDGSINHIEVQPLAPLTAPNEMAETIDNVIVKLQSDSSYKRMFNAAFGDETVTSQRMLLALTQFVGSITSSNARYDKVKRGEASFNQYENEGYRIFQSKCASCHQEPLFTDNSFRNNGLPVNATFNDLGRMGITGNAADSLHFKVPSLRNLMLTFPYMHDGRFKSPMAVLDHYSDGIVNSASLDPLLKNRIPLDQGEKFYLLEFFKTLTDSVLLNDQRFAPPL
jgi:cytochrome c peroxidase